MNTFLHPFIKIIKSLHQHQHNPLNPHSLQNTNHSKTHPNILILQTHNQYHHNPQILNNHQHTNHINSNTIPTIVHEHLNENQNHISITIKHQNFNHHTSNILIQIQSNNHNQHLNKHFKTNPHPTQNPNNLNPNIKTFNTHNTQQNHHQTLKFEHLKNLNFSLFTTTHNHKINHLTQNLIITNLIQKQKTLIFINHNNH